MLFAIPSRNLKGNNFDGWYFVGYNFVRYNFDGYNCVDYNFFNDAHSTLSLIKRNDSDLK